jgi:hypothetical protein
MGRVGLAFRCFFRVLSGKPVPEEALPEQEATPALPAPDEDVIGRERAVQMLGLLQKEGRLLDFLLEDIGSYSDDQIGAAVRTIHTECRRALEEHMAIEPVLAGEEDSRVVIESGFDPSRVRLIGNVTGDPPFNGVLRHHGWRAKDISIPPLPKEGDKTVIAPAEVELA